MCKIIKSLVIVCLLIPLTLLSGCKWITYQYPFEQELSNVAKVEVCRYENDTYSAVGTVTLVTELDSESAVAILEDLPELSCYKHFGDFPLGSYGDIILYITYTDGAEEVIGPVNTASVLSNDDWWIKGYYFDDNQWSTLITKYVDIELVPELEKYLE